jgi:SAM-dependent methyltransferase
LLPGAEYTGIDVGGAPDLVINLEKVDRLPFPDRSFDCVVCADVLEHLDNLHHSFGELVRVSSRHIVLSLPNNWANARRPVSRGKGAIGHYGLSVDPLPDRHKWFFSLLEAAEFIEGQALKHGLTIAELYAMEKPRPAVVRLVRKLLNGSQMRYLNRYAHTLWSVLSRPTR